ncbi:hypothetical protein K8T06_08185, partial [bacterium]|nr:hypothetical protein [bacterium]
MPSHKARKGTDAVLRVIDELRKTHQFEFHIVHGVKRSEALKFVATCDIFLDQFVEGLFGLASLESMSFGKPTVCYINPVMRPNYPSDLPIVNADQENLIDVVRSLLNDGQKRRNIGLLSRAYVEKYHDSKRLAQGLVRIYEELITKKSIIQNDKTTGRY